MNTGAIPKSMAARRQWVNWRNEGGKKIPYSPVLGHRASVVDPSTWGTFDQAVSAGAGIGFVLTAQDPFVALDLDSVLAGGVAEGWAAELVKRAHSYTEVSQSGHGLHIIATATGVQETFQKKYDTGRLEVYFRARYIAMTGDLWPESPLEPLDATSLIVEVAGPKHAPVPLRAVLATADQLAEKCAWLAHCRDDAAELPEPEWYAMLSIVGRTENGSQVAHDWSLSHPKYSAADTDSKLNRAILSAGPRTCSGVSREFGDEYCHDCSLLGKIRTPLHAVGRPKADQALASAIGLHKDPATLIDGFHATDVGNADRLIRSHGGDVLSYHGWPDPLAWDGRRWANGASAVQEWLVDVAHDLFDLLERPMEAEAAVAHYKWAKESEAKRRISAVADFLRRDGRVQISPTDLNPDPWLLSCRNCVVDLRTGEARGHRREDYITEQADVNYEEDAPWETWRGLLESSVRDSETEAFLSRAVGYTLTGITSEKCLLFLHGPSNSGKTTFVKLLMRLLGSYGKPIPQDLLMAKSQNGHPTEIAQLFGCRMAVASETEEGHRLNEALVKLITGGDDLVARRMREDFWSFRPSHKIWVTGNHRPVVRGTDAAIWNRIVIVPFQDPGVDDRGLFDKLWTERSGILNWAVRGCLAWQGGGLQPPAGLVAAKEGYRAEQDTVALFLNESVERAEGQRLEKSLLYRSYRSWAELSLADRFPLGREAFNRRVDEKGYETLVEAGVYYWSGVDMRSIPLDLRVRELKK